jgi:hypothetical protein
MSKQERLFFARLRDHERRIEGIEDFLVTLGYILPLEQVIDTVGIPSTSQHASERSELGERRPTAPQGDPLAC